MKKYKLLKDIPWLEVGAIIGYVWPRTQYSNDNVRINRWMKEWIDIDWNNLNSFQKYSYKLLENIIENNHYYWWLEEIKEPKNIYNLKKWDTYFYIDDLWYIQSIVLDCIQYYKLRLEVWNVFLTYKEVLKVYYERKALERIKKWIWENEIELWKKKWTIIRYEESIKLHYIITETFWYNEIHFKHSVDAKKCLKECEQDWNILFDLN